ncbi:MAG: hypothetical protein IT385_12140 [Deltaproteobacteria bacterium]|nr:hypothetical protein [Deltaproteobacteria bacterium]
MSTTALTAVLTLALAASLAACGGGSSSDDATPTDATPVDAADTSPDVAPETSTSDDAVTTDSTTPPPDVADAPDASDADATTDTTPDAPDVTDAADAIPGPALAGPCPLERRLGGFQVVDDGEYGWVDGTVDDAVLPVSVLTLVATEGDCRLWKKTNPFCDPPCAPGQACAHDGACIPHPEPQDLGTVTVTGLAGPVVMTPIQPGNLYYATDVPYPPWTPGAALALSTTGGAIPAFALAGVGPEPLAPTASQWTLAPGQPLEVAWAPPAAAEPPTRVELSLLIDQHGNSPASLRCDLVDDGQATVPSAILEALRSAGVSGFPSGRLVRQTVDHVTLPDSDGCVDFAARSPRAIRVVVSGHTPCTKEQDCPDGQTCDEAVETCVPE